MSEKKSRENIFNVTGVSVSVLAELSGKTRETVAKRIRGVEPCRKTQGYNVYTPSEALKVIYAEDYKKKAKSMDDETPMDKKLHYEGELKKLDFEIRTGELIPQDTFYDTNSTTFRLVVSNLENLPDILEAEAGLNSDQKEKVDNAIRGLRVKLYEEITDGD